MKRNLRDERDSRQRSRSISRPCYLTAFVTFLIITTLTASSAQIPGKSKPVLYLLAIGINEYEDPAFDLGFARPDAEAIARFFEQHDKLFSSVSAVKLLDKDATKPKIQQALRQFAERAKPQDLVLIYMAGHGVGLGQQFHFLAQEMRTEEDEEAAIRKYGIPASVLGDALLNVKAIKQVLILDTCATKVQLQLVGAAELQAVKMLARSNGFYLIAATGGEDAYEVPELGHGILTYALLSALGEEGQPQASTGPGGTVTMHSLIQYVSDRVPELAEKYHKRRQFPVIHDAGADFPLSVR